MNRLAVVETRKLTRIYSDQSDPIQRALLQNMLKTQQHGVKLLQCTELEETRSGLPTLSSKTATLMQRTIALLSNTLLLTGDPQRTRAADAPTLSTDHPPVLNELDRNSEFRPFDADFKYPVDDGGKRGSIGSAVPRSQKEGGLDTMLSKWINPPEYHSQDGHLVAPSYDSLPIQDVSPLSSLGVQSGYFANPTEEFSSEVAIIQELQEERQGLQEDICRYRSHANKLRMNEYHKRLKDSEDMMKILIEGKDKEQEHDRFEIEKELKQCDTRQERQKSLEKELERCREDYRIQVLEQPDQSHKTLKRQIQSMEGHLEHYSAENASLAEIRQESQRRMKTMQMYYKTFVAKCKDDHNATAKELEGSRSLLPYPGQEELERKIAEVEQELTVLGGQLQTQNSGQVLLPNKFTLESSVPSTNKTPQQRNSYRQPRPLNGPVWLDSESGEPDGVLKEESAGNGYSDKIVVDGSEPKTDSRGWGGGSNQTAGYPTNDHAAHVHPHPSSLLHPSWSSSSRDSVPTSPPSYSSGGSRRQHSTSSSTTTSSSPSTHRYSANIDSDSTSASQKLAKRNMWARFGSGRN
jgi:hypothetical protein